MATTSSEWGDQKIPVNLPRGISPSHAAEFQAFKPFKNWMEQLQKSLAMQSNWNHPFSNEPYSLRSVTIQSFDRFGGGRLGIVKVTASISNEKGESLPAAALLRGPSVAMLVILIPDDAPSESDERYVVLTVQPRIPAGSLGFVELPAGMVDDGSFKGAAAKEIQEELGITIPEDELTCLSELADDANADADAGGGADAEQLPKAMFPSSGGCDEYITIYSHEKRIPREQLKEWNGRMTGLRSEGEKITLKLVRMQDLWKQGARDAKCLAALALWEGLRRERKV